MATKRSKITILDELEDYISPLTPAEFLHLENSLKNEGCRDPLILWKTNGRELVIVDGHNRYKICQRNNIPFTYKTIDFVDINHAKLWMIENQIGRRNLTPEQLSYYRGLKYLAIKKKKGGFANIKAKGQTNKSAAVLLSKQFNVSPSTIKRDGRFAEGLAIVGRNDPKLKLQLLKGELKMKKNKIQSLISQKDGGKTAEELQNETTLRERTSKEGVLRQAEDHEIEALTQQIVLQIRKIPKKPRAADLQELKWLLEKLEHQLLIQEKSP